MNKVMLMGRLTKDPESRNTQNSSMTVCTFTLAVSRWRKNDGKDEADFIPIVVFGKTADMCLRNLNKGRQIALVGRINVSSWGDQGDRKWKTEVIADEIHFAGSKKDNEFEQNQQMPGDQATNTNSQPNGDVPLSDEDDLPF